MEMLNKAFEDARAFEAFEERLTRKAQMTDMQARLRAAMADADDAASTLTAVLSGEVHTGKPPKRPGENRAQYRARMRAEG